MKRVVFGLSVSLIAMLVFGLSLAKTNAADNNAADWKKHTVYQLNGGDRRIKLAADLWVASGKWNERAQLPYFVYIPEKNRLLLHIDRQKIANPGPMFIYSDDSGATWCDPYYMHTDAQGNSDGNSATGVTYIGNGKLIAAQSYYWFSSDYGLTWGNQIPVPNASDGKPLYEWGPLMVDTDPATGKITRLVETRYKENAPWGVDDSILKDISQASIRFSTDEGKTWDKEITVPQWSGVNEVEQIRAANGDIVAALRIDMPMPFKTLWHDNYCGLGISISKDNGYTWSPVKTLFHWGRQHQSLIKMPNGDIVMSYLVRRGYPNTPDGQHSQFGTEAIVSHDNGQTWDLDHRYILYVWESPISSRDTYNDMSAGCVTSTVALPDGTIFTAIGDGHRLDTTNRDIIPRDITVVKWRLNPKPANQDHRIASAPYDSDLRNKINPFPKARLPKVTSGKNIAALKDGAKVSTSRSGVDPRFFLYDEYLYPSSAAMTSIPAWIQIQWPAIRKIDAIDIYPSDPSGYANPSTECTPLDYRLQYMKNGEWLDLIPPVVDAPRYIDWYKPGQRVDGFIYKHTFKPVSTTAVRMFITRSSDSGKRVTSAGKVVVAPEDRCTIIRSIDVFEAK